MGHRALQGDCKRKLFLGVHFLSEAMKESVLIVIGNGIVGSERSVESPDCLLLSVILKLLLPSKMYFGKKKIKLFVLGACLQAHKCGTGREECTAPSSAPLHPPVPTLDKDSLSPNPDDDAFCLFLPHLLSSGIRICLTSLSKRLL